MPVGKQRGNWGAWVNPAASNGGYSDENSYLLQSKVLFIPAISGESARPVHRLARSFAVRRNAGTSNVYTCKEISWLGGSALGGDRPTIPWAQIMLIGDPAADPDKPQGKMSVFTRSHPQPASTEPRPRSMQ